MKLLQRLAIGYIRTKFKLLAFVSKRKTAEGAFRLFCTPLVRSVNKTRLQGAEPISFTFDGLRIHGYRWNHPQQKKILILHGFNSAAHKFADYGLALAAKGYEVLAFDAPAHGKSEGKTTNAVECSRMVRLIVEEFGPIDGFIAHSFGAIALSLALEETAHDSNMKAVLIAPATETTSAVNSAFELLKLHDEAVQQEFHNIIYEKSGKQAEWFSIRRAMWNIKARVLWVHDEDDGITPWIDAEKVKQDNHPHIRFVITKGLGHQKIYRDDTIKKEVIGFL